jgi:hypothetical protein
MFIRYVEGVGLVLFDRESPPIRLGNILLK